MTAETCPHYFTLTEDALAGFDTNCKVNPPLRTEADRRAVIAGLADGTIDCIATDHAPHLKGEKDAEFDAAPPGIVGFETAFSLGYEQLVLGGRTEPARLRRAADRPRRPRILGLALPGIAPGAEAELVVLDLKAEWTLSEDRIVSQSRNTPFLGRKLFGRVATVVLRDRSCQL